MKICLSSIETAKENAQSVYMEQAPSVLTSFYYAKRMLKNQSSPRTKFWFGALKQASFRMVDSGAHTMRKGSDTDYDRLLHEYVTWLVHVAPQKIADVWVEMDITNMAGKAWVDNHRQRLIQAGVGYGLIQVWHSREHDWDYWLWLLKEAKQPGRSGFVAIEGNYAGDYRPFIDSAYRAGVKIHGFKLTNFADLQKWPFYSVDSTSWQAHMRYGIPSGRHLGWPSARRKADPAWKGVMPRSKTTFHTRLSNLRANARMWIEAEKHITALWRARGIDWEKI